MQAAAGIESTRAARLVSSPAATILVVFRVPGCCPWELFAAGTSAGYLLFVGPVFTRELVTAPRRGRLFLYRTVYAGVLFGVMCTAWLVLTQTHAVRNVGDMANFGAILFQLLAPLQLAIVTFSAALSTAGAVSQEKDRQTLILLLLTRLNNSELVLGKLLASLVHVLTMLLAGLPVFALAILLGGISFQQLARHAGDAGDGAGGRQSGIDLCALREKTFQTLALTTLALVFWMLICEAVGAGACGPAPFGIAAWRWATAMSPWRAVLAAAGPGADIARQAWYQNPVYVHCLLAGLATMALNGLAIWRIRVWNPSREVRPVVRGELAEQQSIWNGGGDLDQSDREARGTGAPAARRCAPQQSVASTPPQGLVESGSLARSLHLGVRPQGNRHPHRVPAAVRAQPGGPGLVRR